MILLILAAPAAVLGATNYSVSAPMPAPNGKPSFADEFDAKAIDQTKWRFDVSRNAVKAPLCGATPSARRRV